VLLKNEDDLLPLDKDLQSIAVIGPNADDLLVLLGNYNGTPSQASTVLEGIRAKVAPATKLYTARGCHIAEDVPPLTVVPSANLRPLDADAGQTGLTAIYYDGSKIEGPPARMQVDPAVDFNWKDATPLTGHRADAFAVRWEGFLVPPVSGTYKLGATGFNDYRLELDGDLVAEFRGVHHSATRTKDVALEAGRLYHIRLDLVSRAADPQVQLLWSVPGVDYLTAALEAARKADVIVMALGLSPALEGEEMPVHVAGFEGGDRTDIALPQPQEELLKQVCALGKPVVLALLSGSAVAIKWAAENVPAIVTAWYPGQAGGHAIADVLFGDYNPGGRLPVTFYRSVEDLPPFEDYRMEDHTYRYFGGEPLFPFGYGLSYTTFAYSNLQLSAKALTPTETLTVSVDVSNMGQRAGDEVVQLYVSDVAASVPVPIRQLQGFERVHLVPGETKTITFTLTASQLSLIDDKGRRVIEPGAFQVAVGGRQPVPEDFVTEGTAVLVETFEVTGSVTEI
jgi:beta-glucosidase